MIPLQELLNRIRWDPEFGRGHFELAYYDRVAKALVHVPFGEARFPPGEHFFFEAVTPDGDVHSIPRHRVRTVSRDGAVIWHR
jgi:uncharacterized protein (UPF0248 family)